MNIKIKKSDFLFKLGNNFFKLGILLLPSALFFSSIFLILSLIIGNLKVNLIKDRWNCTLIICSLLMIIICFISNLFPTNFYNLPIDKDLNWLGLLNWIPLFWLYGSSQYYLKDIRGRISCAIFLVLGSIPILISGFFQYYFDWYGPFKLLNGTIIWYQRSGNNLTGPFNNPNIAGTWLAAIFPLCIFFIINSNKFSLKKVFYLFLTSATFLATFLTHSRNAIINISMASILIMGVSFKIIFLIFIIIFTLYTSIFIFEIPLDIFKLFENNDILSGFIPESNKINGLLNFWRIKIWKTAILNIFKNPLIGWGASSFSTLYLIRNGIEEENQSFQHTHNMIIEVAHNYGIIISLILFTTIFLLIYKAKPDLSLTSNDKDLINKFWWISALIILLMHFVDFAYYDGRISILFWILMAGLRCMLREKNLEKLN